MTSGMWITYYLFAAIIVFIVWEFIQLARRRAGNKSARTLSQYVVYRASKGKKAWQIFIVAFPILLIIIGVWLVFHFEGFCHVIVIDFICEISK